MDDSHNAEWIRSADNITLHVREWGRADGREILLIHGLAQSHLSFVRQFDSDLADTHRIVAFDLRGHGMSEKPLDPNCYQDGRRWADDLEAVIVGKKLRAPVVAGWSLGARVIRQYLMHYGDRRLSAINMVSCRPIEDPSVARRDTPPFPADGASDIATQIATAIAFLRACFEIQPEARDFETMLAFNMMVSLDVRRGIAGWAVGIPEAIKVLNAITVPTLVTHGTADRLIMPGAAQMTAGAIPNAKLSLYHGCGHAPFYEDAPRFNRELKAFVAQTWRG